MVKIEEIKHFINNPINIERKPCTYCKDYRLGYWITWDGKIRFCSFLNEPDISIKELSFKEAWQRLVEFEEQLDWPQECKECDFSKDCFKCAATLATNSGIVHKINKEYCENYCRQQDIKRQEYQQGQRKPLPCASGARLLPAQHFRAALLLLRGERLRLRTGRRRLLPGGRALGGPLSVRPCGRPCGLLLPFLPYGSLFQGRALPSIKFPDCIIACFVELGKGFFTICSEKSYLTVWIRFILTI